MKIEKINKLFFSTLVTSILLVSFTPLASYPLDYYWKGGSGSWGDPSNWDPYGLPGGWYDNVTITNNPGSNATAYFTGAPYPGDSVTIDHMDIYGTGEGTMTLSVSSGEIISIGHGVGFFGVIIGNNGIITQTGGRFVPCNHMDVGSGGIYNLEGGTLSQFEYDTFVHGVFNQTGGTNEGTDSVRVSGGGVYNLSGTGQVRRDSFDVAGVFNQQGGMVSVSMKSQVSGGIYNLVAGEMEGQQLFISKSGTFNQSGGTSNAGTLEVGYDVWGNKSDGTYNLSGGNLTASGILNAGTINYSGGELHLGAIGTGTLTNNGTTNLSGSGTRVIDGNIVNNGTFKTTHTTAVYNGTFTNNGAYISDPATQYFNDLIIGKNGYLVGQYNDHFYINGNFINNSTMNTDWNTIHSNLSFLTGVDNLHDLYLVGMDYGAKMSGFSNNFSWGTLDITGNILSLYDGNDIAGGALYLREISGLSISGNMIANIFGMDGLNIYYMANLPSNWYLHGLEYDLEGGGHLIPIPTPEPATMLLLGSGLLGLWELRRKFIK